MLLQGCGVMYILFVLYFQNHTLANHTCKSHLHNHTCTTTIPHTYKHTPTYPSCDPANYSLHYPILWALLLQTQVHLIIISCPAFLDSHQTTPPPHTHTHTHNPPTPH